MDERVYAQRSLPEGGWPSRASEECSAAALLQLVDALKPKRKHHNYAAEAAVDAGQAAPETDETSFRALQKDLGIANSDDSDEEDAAKAKAKATSGGDGGDGGNGGLATRPGAALHILNLRRNNIDVRTQHLLQMRFGRKTVRFLESETIEQD